MYSVMGGELGKRIDIVLSLVKKESASVPWHLCVGGKDRLFLINQEYCGIRHVYQTKIMRRNM